MNPKSTAEAKYLKKRRLLMTNGTEVGTILRLEHLTGVDLLTIDLDKLASHVALTPPDPDIPENLLWLFWLAYMLRGDLQNRIDSARKERGKALLKHPSPDA